MLRRRLTGTPLTKRLRPRRRAVDRTAMCPDGDYLWKLAFRWKVTGDVPALCGVKTEVCRALTRIEHNCPPLEFVAHKVERRNEIRITGDNDKSIGGICIGIAEKRCREIYVRPFLFDLYHMDKTFYGRGTFLASGIDGGNPRLVLVVVAFDDIHAAMRDEGLKVDVLTFNRSGIVRRCLGSGGEVLDGYKFVICVKMGMGEHGVDKRGDVKPFAEGESAQQSVVEITTVNVGDCFHLRFIKKRGPQTLRPKTLFRVGRTLRLDMNLLRGSAHIVPNCIARNKWGNSGKSDARKSDFAVHHLIRYGWVVLRVPIGRVVEYCA